ncbi:hypothetical protein LJR016_001398 [Devosia sp. LjRoot16]|uniref:hypothetical protein n=1 Tax=Devosia sp. LjRoot16 TaxID=3342271 RepID=UPI003ECEBB5C
MPGHRMPMRGYWIWLGVLVAITAVPILLAMVVGWFMQLNGCASNWKMGSTCVLGGADWGRQLNGTLAWSLIVAAITIWITLLGGAIWLVSLIVSLAGWQRLQRFESTENE